VENYCSGLGDVYTFSPTFRSENSNTKKHLSEFWMIEPELAFADLRDNMDCAEEFVKYTLKYILENNKHDLKFFEDNGNNTSIEKIRSIINQEFGRVSYSDAIYQLQKAAQRVKFEVKPEWGIDLATEHERYLVEKVYRIPIFVYNYPKEIKAFYMRANPDNRTVAAMDLLIPGIGELVGGSQREERKDTLLKRIQELNLSEESYDWYLELRKFGSIPHSGFGLGLERLLMFVTGLENIREVIPFPRWPGNANF